MIIEKMNKHKIFIKKMRDLGYEPEDYYKWKCIGCSPVPKGRDSIIWSHKWLHLEDRLPNFSDTCFCTHHPIKYNYYIYNEEDDLIITVGSECVNKVGDSHRYKRCDGCGEKHSNRLDNFCDDCRLQNELKEKQETENKYQERKKNKNILCWDCGKKCEPYMRCRKCHYIKKGWNTF